MKFHSIIIFALIANALAFSPPRISDTKSTCTKGSKTGNCCAWEGAEIWPEESFNQPGECRILTCLNNFDISITPCPFDITGRYKWIHEDKSLLYPDCCGRRVDTFMETEVGS
jgi:hypothetical protein